MSQNIISMTANDWHILLHLLKESNVVFAVKKVENDIKILEKQANVAKNTFKLSFDTDHVVRTREHWFEIISDAPFNLMK